MNPKVIKALDSVIAGLDELKEALEASATKSGSAADDGAAGKVSRSKGKAADAEVPAARKASRAAPDVDADMDDDLDGGTDSTDDDDDIPPPSSKTKVTATKGKAAPAAPAAKGKATPATKGKAAEGSAADLDAVREALTKVINTEGLGRKKALEILAKFGANASADLDEDDYAGVIKACNKAVASATPPDEGEDDDL